MGAVRQTVELEFSAPPQAPTPTPQPEAQPPQQPEPVQPTPPTPTNNNNARVIRNNTTPQNNTVEPNPTTQNTQTANPENTNTGTQQVVDPFPWRHNNGNTANTGNTGRVLSAVELMNPGATSMMVAAQAGGVHLPSSGEVRRTSGVREIIHTNNCRGTAEECARVAVMGAILEPSSRLGRPDPAGTSRTARQVITAANSTFLPVRQIPNVGHIVMNAPVFTPPASTREVPAGEQAVNNDVASRLAQSGIPGGGGTVTIPAPSYHLVRAEIEVDQAPTGTILEVRVATSSRSQTFDQAAQRAIREALAEAEPFNTSAPRRSRWAFEVSDAVRGERIDSIIRVGGSDPNLGWNVIPEESNGVRLRYRVRHVGTRLLPVTAPATGAPGQPARAG